MNRYFIFIVSLIFSVEAFAMGAKRPKPPTNGSGSSDSEISVPKPTLNFGDKINENEFIDSALTIGTIVDQFNADQELQSERTQVNNDQVDHCSDSGFPEDRFSEKISYHISKMLEDTGAFIGGVGSYYGTSSNEKNYFPVSLVRHRLCQVTKNSLNITLAGKTPDSETIEKINRFVVKFNSGRDKILSGNNEYKKEILNLWTGFYSCLAYTESLSTADSSSSNKVASKYAPENYRKPAGVKFYEDPYQSESSRLNIGLFQFTPSASNNIAPCIKAWNNTYKERPECQIKTNASNLELIKVVGSSHQSFNAFCGIHKMLQTFSVQVNTKNSSSTHPDNLLNGKLKNFEDRCVSPHFKAGKAYVHFGPFMNSTGTNLKELFQCIDQISN